jgi:metalloendopeptidase OMA1, mitochondrial
MTQRSIPAAALCCLVLVLFAGCDTAAPPQGPGHRPQSLALSPKQELSLGKQAYEEVLAKSHVVKGGPDVERVERVGRRIVKAVEIKPLQREMNLRLDGYTYDWHFTVLDDKQVNAFCLPGGYVAVFTGLLRVAENDDQLAAVMGHEIGHALAHHASERIARQQKYQTALDAINGAMGTLDENTRKELIGLLAAGAEAGSLKYDRQQESEADHIGLFLMTFADYDPHEAEKFWQNMEKRSGGGPMPEILSDHPSDAHRLQDIHHWIPRVLAAKQAWKQGRVAPEAGS